MRSARSFLLLIAALVALTLQPAAAVAAGAQLLAISSAASAERCPSDCSEMPGNCSEGCMGCDGVMPNCRATANCGMAVTVEPAISSSDEGGKARSLDISPSFPALHGRSIKPETHPPSPLGQQA